MGGAIRYQVASDVERDGLALEALDAAGNVIFEIFRADADGSYTVDTFGHDIAADQLCVALEVARMRLPSGSG